MERNYSMIMKQLQMAYMQVTLKDVKEDENQCMYCWGVGCGCSENSVQTDSFLNLTTISDIKFAIPSN